MPSLEVAPDKDLLSAMADVAPIRAQEPEFQLAVNRYERSRGGSRGSALESAHYLQSTLYLACQLKAAIIPHPERWTTVRPLSRVILSSNMGINMTGSMLSTSMRFGGSALNHPDGYRQIRRDLETCVGIRCDPGYLTLFAGCEVPNSV